MGLATGRPGLYCPGMLAWAEAMRYGLGCWLGAQGGTVILEGLDAGVSFRSVHDPGPAVTRTVISNSSYGAWPVAELLDELLGG